MRGEEAGSKRYIYMDVVRIVGCILVICLHMATIDIDRFSVNGMEWKVMNAQDSIGMTGISFFFMISGALFLRADSNLNLKYVWKKIGMLFLVYIIALFGYSIVPFIRGWEPWEWYYIKNDIVDKVLYGTSMYHLSFPPVLMVLYALSPVLKDAFAKKRNCEYFLMLYTVFGAIIPFLLLFDFSFNSYLQSFQNRFGLFWLTGHIGYFVLGHYLHSFVDKLSRKKVILAIAMTIGTSAVTILCNHKDAVSKNGFSIIANTPLSITGFLFAMSVYMLIKTGMANFKAEKGIKILKYISGLTFGIYLVHPFVMNTFVLPYSWGNIIGNYGVLVISRILFVVVVSALITAVLKLIPGVKRLL